MYSHILMICLYTRTLYVTILPVHVISSDIQRILYLTTYHFLDLVILESALIFHEFVVFPAFILWYGTDGCDPHRLDVLDLAVQKHIPDALIDHVGHFGTKKVLKFIC